MRSMITTPPKDIMISLEGMPGPALGCIMVDSSMKMFVEQGFHNDLAGHSSGN